MKSDDEAVFAAAGGVSLWYLPASTVTAAASSSTKAARSTALANRSSPSIAKVANGFLDDSAPVIKVPKSRTNRAATASILR